jgi:hypothetical protein
MEESIAFVCSSVVAMSALGRTVSLRSAASLTCPTMAASSPAVYALAVGVGVGVVVAATVVAGPAGAAGVDPAAFGSGVPPQAETAVARRTETAKVPSTDVFKFPPIFCVLPVIAG